MPKYKVTTREVWTVLWEVEADTPGEAKTKVYRGHADVKLVEGTEEFSHNMGAEHWDVEETIKSD